jgi:putative transposase
LELAKLFGIKDDGQLIESHHRWVEEILKNGSNQRDAKWTESIAVGDRKFVLETKIKLGARAIGRKVLEENENYMIRESQTHYATLFLTLKRMC